jgi:YmgG-like glycine-zipper protein
MRKPKVMMIGLAMVSLAACDRGQDANKLASDTALSRDLNLANQAQPFQGLDSMSALEAARQAESAPLAAAPVPRSTASSAAPTRRAASSTRRSTRTYPTSTRRRSTSSGGSSTASSGDIGTRSEGRVVVKKNTRRDAAIGAGAGAVIGAVTSRNKVKGAVIGGVAGGVLGAIIGNNVDVQKKRVP